jgi:hypothetical protein
LVSILSLYPTALLYNKEYKRNHPISLIHIIRSNFPGALFPTYPYSIDAADRKEFHKVKTARLLSPIGTCRIQHPANCDEQVFDDSSMTNYQPKLQMTRNLKQFAMLPL